MIPNFKFHFFFIVISLTRHTLLFGQVDAVLTDSTAFIQFLRTQDEIPGLYMRLSMDATHPLAAELDTNLFMTQPLEGGRIAARFTRLSDVDAVLSGRYNPGNGPITLDYFVFDEKSTLPAVQEYIGTLIKHRDISLTAQNRVAGTDLVALANRAPYPAFGSSHFGFFNDLKFFLIMLIMGLFLFFALAMIGFMLVYKARKNLREKLRLQYDQEIVTPLSEILFEKELDELRNLTSAERNTYFPDALLGKALYQEVLMERIISLNKKMKGDFKLKLNALYTRLGLDKVSIKKLKSSEWDVVVEGIVQINEMDLAEALPAVKKHVNSPNFHVRSQAVTTVLNLSERVDLQFLRDQTFPLSRWQQMNYLRIIKALDSHRNLNMRSLFDSKNASIRIFAYRLVRMIGRVDLLEELGRLFDQVPEEEKIEIIKTLEYFGAPLAPEQIQACLVSENPGLVRVMAQAAGVIGGEETALQLIGLLGDGTPFGLRQVLLESLKKLDLVRFEEYTRLDAGPDTQRIKKHLADPLLQHV